MTTSLTDAELDAMEARHQRYREVWEAPRNTHWALTGLAGAAASADDVPTLVAEVRRQWAKVDELCAEIKALEEDVHLLEFGDMQDDEDG